MKEEFKKLKEIIPFEFRVGSGIGKKDQYGKYPKYFVLGYIDSRDAQNRLDELFGMCRSDEYKEISNNLFCGVTINGQTRRDCGTESMTEKEKGQASDAFKRACVKRGLGRFLYTLPSLVITFEEYEKNKYDVTKFVKNKYKKELQQRHKDFISENNK